MGYHKEEPSEGGGGSAESFPGSRPMSGMFRKQRNSKEIDCRTIDRGRIVLKTTPRRRERCRSRSLVIAAPFSLREVTYGISRTCMDMSPNQKPEGDSRGGGVPLADCSAQDINIGDMRINAVDFGDTSTASTALQRSKRDFDNSEANRSALLHLVAIAH